MPTGVMWWWQTIPRRELGMALGPLPGDLLPPGEVLTRGLQPGVLLPPDEALTRGVQPGVLLPPDEALTRGVQPGYLLPSDGVLTRGLQPGYLLPPGEVLTGLSLPTPTPAPDAGPTGLPLVTPFTPADREPFEREDARYGRAPAVSPGTLGERRISGQVIRTGVGILGRLFGPIGNLVASIINAFVPSTVVVPGTRGARTPESQVDPAALSTLTAQQVRELARASVSDPDAARTLQAWREQQRRESAARFGRIDVLLADMQQPGPTGTPVDGEGLPPAGPPAGEEPPADGDVALPGPLGSRGIQE